MENYPQIIPFTLSYLEHCASFCVCLISCKDSGCLKKVSETNGCVMTNIKYPTYLVMLASVQRIAVLVFL